MPTKIVTAVDVGTTKIATIVANVRAQEDIEVLGVGVVPSHGLHKGIVVNMDDAKESIAASVREAQKISGMKIDSAYVGVTGRHISSLNNKGVVAIPRDDRLVKPQDLKRVLATARSITIPEGKRLLHAIPRYYTLNGEERVNKPVGMHGTRLDVETHIITASVSSVQNLAKCIRSIGVDVQDLILEPLASGEAVLTTQERDSGVIMADVGGGTTDIAVFKDGNIYHTAIVPVAGYQVTSDIAIGLGLPFHVAERMKKTYGNVTPGLDTTEDASTIGIENGHSASYKELCDITRSRMEELFELMLLEMPSTDYQSLAPCGIVLTGGTANLTGLAELGKSMLHMPVRKGAPLGAGIYGITDILRDSAYATTTGLVLWQARSKEGSSWQVKRGGVLGGFAKLMRKLFRS
ncbi:MAG: cell division protein FtsA [Chloroflexota bacterium]